MGLLGGIGLCHRSFGGVLFVGEGVLLFGGGFFLFGGGFLGLTFGSLDLRLGDFSGEGVDLNLGYVAAGGSGKVKRPDEFAVFSFEFRGLDGGVREFFHGRLLRLTFRYLGLGLHVGLGFARAKRRKGQSGQHAGSQDRCDDGFGVHRLLTYAIMRRSLGRRGGIKQECLRDSAKAKTGKSNLHDAVASNGMTSLYFGQSA